MCENRAVSLSCFFRPAHPPPALHDFVCAAQPGVEIPLGDLFGGSSDLAALLGDARLRLSAIGLSLANPLGFHLAGAVLGATFASREPFVITTNELSKNSFVCSVASFESSFTVQTVSRNMRKTLCF